MNSLKSKIKPHSWRNTKAVANLRMVGEKFFYQNFIMNFSILTFDFAYKERGFNSDSSSNILFSLSP